MDCLIGIVSSLVTRVAEYTLSPIINRVKYLSNHEQNVQNLKDRAGRLKNARDRVQHSVDAAKGNGHEIEHDVDDWLSTVDKKIREEVEEVLQDEEKEKKKCFVGLCPNPWTRYKHSLKAEEETKAVAELLERGNFEKVWYRSAPRGFIPIKGFDEFESRTLVLNGVMDALKDDGISVVGVYGMGGIGKTTLVKEVARQVEGRLFDSVVIATVTQTLDVEKIQNQIGKAVRLRKRLMKEKRILVVVDDIWTKLDLGEVGIPFGDEHKGCKLLLTSRELNVLSNGMDTQKNFEVGDLNEKEAWDLFKKMSGDYVENTDLKPTAMEVAKRCAGLPIAIATVARALRNKSLSEWKNALRELNRPSLSNFKGITAAYSAIEWSCNYLESEEVKLTFLLCSLIGHNGLVEDLVRYTLGLGLFGGVNTVEEARDKVVTVVADLKASCLLLDSYNDGRFDIHDVVWDAALNIASRDNYMLVLRDHVPKEWFDKEKMNNWRVISLRFPQIIAELPKEIECPGLSFFHMAHSGSVEIPPDFFRQTKSLKVLDLFGMQFPSLPVSINHLTGLYTLCLKGCALKDITIVGKLQNLEILNLAESDIKALAKEIAQLTRLKLLDLSGCTKLKIIPPNVLSSLSKLEELYMERSFAKWEDEVGGKERSNASLDELNRLSHLTTLYAGIPDAQMIPKHRFIETLNRYKIFIGDDYNWSDWSKRHEHSRTLKLKLYTSMCLENGVRMLLKKVEDLYLEGVEGIKNVLVELNNGEDFPHIKRLHVNNGKHVQYITMKKIEFCELRSITLEDLPQLISFCSVDERGSTSSDPLPLFNKQFVFPRLESLVLSSIKAQTIWHNHTYSWVSNLLSLIIKGCPNLERLLTSSLARSLVQLQRFEIKDCECLREIIITEEIEEETKDVICFPQLNSLHISDLPNLVIFCSGTYNIEFPLLKELTIENCYKLEGLISQTGNQSGMHALFNDKVAVPSLEKMTIWGLRNVKNVFPASIAKELPKLEVLKIKNCGVEEIVSVGEGVEQPVRFKFPQLSSLKLIGLKKLKCFYGGQHTIIWPMLKELSTECSTLLKILGFESTIGQSVFLVNEVIPKLEELELHNIGDIMDQFPPDMMFHQIKVFKANRSLAGSSVLPFLLRFYNLETLEFFNLDFKDEISCKAEAESLTRIRNLKLSYSENLKHVWKKDSKLGHILSSLQTLIIESCDDLINVGPSSLSFQNLNTLKVSCCDEMRNLVTPTVVQNLAQLTTLEVFYCRKMTEIVENIGGDDATYHHQTTLVLSKLKSLELSSLKNLTSFSSGSYSFEFPCLEKLVVDYCPRLKIFSEGVLSTPLLQSVIVDRYIEKKRHWSGDLNTTIQQLFRKRVALEFSDTLPDMMEIWNGRKPQEYWDFRNIREMKFCNCSSLKYIFTPSMLLSLEQLCVIEIKECDSMEEVIKEEEEATSTNELRFPNLISIRIESCSNLTIFYLGSRGLEFPKLDTIKIANCPKLTTLCSSKVENEFPASIAKDVPKLEDLRIRNCGVEQIVSIEEGVEQPVRFEFPRMSSLELTGLKSLKCFYEGQHKIVWPMLKKLSTDSSTLESLIEQPIFLVNEVISKLEELELHKIGDIMDLFHQIKVFKVNGSLAGSSVFSFLRRFNNLETFKLQNLNFKDEVPCKVEGGTLTGIPNLKLKGCKNLKHIWKKDSELDCILSGLQTLIIESCDDLINVGPSSLSFQNLNTLKVSCCDEMRNLVTHTVVQNLAQLTTLEVSYCQKMTEIVENIEGDNATYHHQTTLVLSKLKSLELSSLKNLTSFSSGSYSFEFPCLEKLVVDDCPRLKIFSEGVLSTPLLQSVIEDQYFKRKRHWSGDLNTTIQQLYTEKVGFDGLWKLEFSDTFPDLMEIWNSRNAREILCFKSLRTIIFCKCSSLKFIFTPSMLLSLVDELRFIEVKECNSVEEVIKEEEEATSTHNLILCIRSIKIESCSKLTNFYLGSRAFEFPNLTTIEIADCPKMTAFCSSTSRDKRINGDGNAKGVGLGDHVQHNTTAAFFSDQVVCSELKTLELSSTNIHKIWHNHIVHERLYDLRVKDCHNLKFLFPSFNMTERFEKLNELQIQNCDSLEEIFGAQGLVADESLAVTSTQSITAEAVTTEFAFPRLTYLRLDKLPKLKSFCSRMHTTRWPSLEKMDVIECPQVQIFGPQCPCSGDAQTESRFGISNQQPLFYINEDTFPSLGELTVKQNDMMKGICDGQLSLEFFGELKALNLEFFPETSTTLPYSFIHSLPNLEKLRINDASICQIVQSEGFGQEEIHTSRLARIKELRLSKLPELTLKTLEPSLLFFKNLTTLEVSRCHGFVKLMAFSTAKSLMLLVRMSITECEMLEEIIACEGEEGHIVFPKLKYLRLSCLPSLASFSSVERMLEFPIVRKCKKMRNFCRGDLSTPKLQRMHLTRDDEDELWWEGDLNTTVRHIFDEKSVQTSDVTEVPPFVA